MTSMQDVTKTIIQAAIKAFKAAITAVKKAENYFEDARIAQPAPRVSKQVLKQSTVNRKVPDKQHALGNFENEIRNIFLANNDDILDSENMPKIMS